MRLSSSTRRVAVGLALVLIVAGAGCLEAIGDQTKQVIGTDETDPGANDSREDEDVPTEEGTARSRYVHAMNALGDDEIERWSMSMRVEAASGSMVENSSMLVDTSKHVMVASIENETAGEGAGSSTSEAPDPWGTPPSPDVLLFGQVGRTFLVGSQEPLVLMGNHSPDRGYPGESLNLTSPYDDQEVPGQTGNGPDAFLQALQDVPEGAEVTERTITYEGQPATEMNVSYENATSSGDLRVVILHGPDRPALVEGTLTGPHVDLTTGGSDDGQGGTVRMTFAYGADATHPQEEAMIRAEAMTLSTDSPMLGGSSGTGDGTTVIQPSINPGLIPLEEVQVHLQLPDLNGSIERSDPLLSLDAEDGETEIDGLVLRYEDTDGDGFVSPGDRVGYESNASNFSGYSVTLEDEVTGMKMTPAPGLAAIVLGALSAGALLRRDDDP